MKKDLKAPSPTHAILTSNISAFTLKDYSKSFFAGVLWGVFVLALGTVALWLISVMRYRSYAPQLPTRSIGASRDHEEISHVPHIQ